MLKKALVGFGLLAASCFASANIIVTDTSVSGADMVGMEVTVSFADGSSDSGFWQMISNTPLSTGNPILDLNGFSGGVVKSTWSLIQEGLTLGGFDDSGNPYGLWTLSNLSSASDITGFTVSGVGAGIAFDIDPDVVGTPNSFTGQAYVADRSGTSAYSNQVNASGTYTDLFYTLSVTFDDSLAQSEAVLFSADTDALGVSEPASIAFVMSGLFLFARRFARNSK